MVWIWVRRSLRYYGTRHLVFAGAVALTSAILGAALLAGESLQAGLRRGLRERLGATRSAVYLAEGVFPASLAQRLPDAQAALLLRGELLTSEGAVCADNAQVIGVASANASAEGLLSVSLNARGREVLPDAEGAVRFEKPSLYSVEMPLGAAKEARLVRRAVRADGAPGATPPGGVLLMPDFALRASSVPPVNVFQAHGPLSEAAGVPGLANLLVSGKSPQEFERALARTLTPEDAGLTLEDGGRRSGVGGQRSENGEGAGAGSESPVASPSTLIKSRRVFLPPGVGDALAAKGLKAEWATFHLADAFEAGAVGSLQEQSAVGDDAARSTPYGFVAAVTPGLAGVPADLKDDEVVISAWLAEALGVTTNVALTLRWRRFEAGGRLVADSRAFRVRGVLPTEAAALAKRLMPVFPGLEGVDSCAAWDVGLPMDAERLKDPANEAYWKQWRETPKAFLTFEAGRACFGAAFGEAMSARVAAAEAEVRAALRSLAPAQLGFVVRPVWDEGVAVAEGSTDFKGLFAGMAFVLVAAALLLSSLSLSLALERRKGEVALFSALGWGRGRIVRVLAAEWSVPLALGAAAGAGLGAALARALVWSLGRFWSSAFAGAKPGFAFSWPMAGLAAGVSAALALAVLFGTVRRFARCRPVELWQTAGNWRLETGSPAKRGTLWESLLGGALAAGAIAVMVLSPSGSAANGAFFGAGFLLLASMLLFMKTAGQAWRDRKSEVGGQRSEVGGQRSEVGGRRSEIGIASPLAAGVCRALQAPRRSAPVVLLLAVGTFLTIGILSMKHDPAEGCGRPSSGSGGFASTVTSVAPLDRERGLELARRASGAKGVVPVRVREGDEAGCLNMNQPVLPRVLGLEARAMARARAFEPEDSGGVWTAIERPLPDGAIPALAADQTMLQYSLKAKAGARDGTVYDYPGPEGRSVRIRVVGALPVRSGILQGALIVDERAFTECFPGDGYRMWLCDYAPYGLREAAGAGGRRSEVSGRRAEVRERRAEGGGQRSEVRGQRSEGGGQRSEVRERRAEGGGQSAEGGGQRSEVGSRRPEGVGPVADRRSLIAVLRHPEPGVTVEAVEERLRLLGSVESTYLDMFLVLGGLGVVLGVFGVALVILRGVEERRGELALLSAVGLPRAAVVRLLLAEYGAMVLAGLAAGVVPALAAIQPAVRSLGGRMPWGAMAGIVAGLLLCACACVFAAALAASRRFGPEVLKEEV